MKLALMSHVSSEGPEKLLENLERGLEMLDVAPDLICGPDYSLAVHYCDKPNSQQERQAVLKRIKAISKKFPTTAMIPGTMPWIGKLNRYFSGPVYKEEEEKVHMYLSGPVYKAGKMQNEFFKQRNNGESELAMAVGEVYLPGQSEKNKLLIRDKEVCYEICGDHGNQLVDGCFLELISALDFNGGFYISVINDKWRHHGAITNGINGQVSCFTFDPSSSNRLIQNKPIRELDRERISVYQLD
jgi:hypothetical protein